MSYEDKQELYKTEEKVMMWAIERGLHHSDQFRQIAKLGEEYGELCADACKGRDPKDSIGDMLVVLTILCMINKTTLDECFSLAYDEIKDRKGKTVDGVFIKNE